jgi:hypothetical protein
MKESRSLKPAVFYGPVQGETLDEPGQIQMLELRIKTQGNRFYRFALLKNALQQIYVILPSTTSARDTKGGQLLVS